MKTFGGFGLGNEFVYGELRGDEVHRLSQPYWNQVQPTGSTHGRSSVARKFGNRCSSCSIEVDRGRIKLRGSHRGDETHRNRRAINLVQGSQFSAATSRRDRNRVPRAPNGF